MTSRAARAPGVGSAPLPYYTMAITLTIGDHSATLPESWNDMSLQQCLEAYNILTARAGRAFEPGEVLPAKRIALVARLAGLDDAKILAWRQDCAQAYGEEEGDLVFFAELSRVLSLTDFLFDVDESQDGKLLFQVKLGLTRCPWPMLRYTSTRGKQKTYYATADALENITLYEMALSFSLFEKYLETDDIAHADELIATLYRPSKPPTPENKRSGYQGDRRLPIYQHEAMVKKRLPRVAVLPADVKKLLLFWFASCRQQIVASFPNLFEPRGGEMEIGGEKVGNDYGWGGMLLALAGGIVHLEEVSLQPYQNGLIYLSYLEDERKREEMRRKR